MPEERRLVTVLFADVTGSTSLGETLDPEDLRALMARFFGGAREIVTAHGGTVEKFIGDAVMAVFGLPVAHGDDASRAISAALELRDRVRTDGALGERLPIRIGINSGEVVASRDAADGADFMVTGDAVNVAARLVQGADSWAVVVGERTMRAAPDFRYGGTREVDARGKAAPVRAAEVVGRGSIERRPLPLLGRQADLDQLELVARRSFGERRPYLVSVIAPAGTGKTRLLEEFLGRLRRDTPEASIATAQCLPYGQRLTFWPLRAILHTLCGASEDTPTEALREATVRTLSNFGIEQPGSVAERLLATIGAGEEDASDRTELYAAWRTTFEAAAAEKPLVVVFEDLHWSSDSFLDLVEYVTQPRGEARLLMVVLTRAELLDRRPGWGGGRRNHVSLALEPLDAQSIADLVRHLLESASADTIRAVADRSEGNPFYAGELVRSLIDRLGPGPSPAEIERTLENLPDTVQATVLARLDALPDSQRRVLQLGSVFGRAFRPQGLAALEPEIGRLDEVVGSLLDRDMIRASGTDGYVFRHILIREVAYGTLPRSERARLHAAAGDWLEGQAAGHEEAYAELIAYHYREAATLSALLPEGAAREVTQRAVDWLRRAAESAIAAAAQIEARAHLIKALEWAPAAALPDLHERIGDTAVGGDATVEAYRTAYRLAQEMNRPANDVLRMLAKLIEYECRFQGSVGTRTSPEAMAALVAAGRALLERADDPAARARFHTGCGFLPWWRRGSGVGVADDAAQAQAEEDARLGLRYAEEVGDATLRSAALDALGSLALERGNWRASHAIAIERLSLKDRVPVTERVDAQSMFAWSAAALGKLTAADVMTEDALRGLQPGQAPAMVLHLVAWRAHVLYELGRWDEAIAVARRAERLWTDIGGPAALYAIRGFLSGFDVARARQEPDEAAGWREVCERIFDQTPTNDYETDSTRLHLAGDAYGLARQLERVPARHFFERYSRWFGLCSDHGAAVAEPSLVGWLERVTNSGEVILEGQLRRALALVRRDHEQAQRALELFDRSRAVPHSARVRCELGLLNGDEEMYAAGVRTLESLRDIDQLERYEARRAGR